MNCNVKMVLAAATMLLPLSTACMAQPAPFAPIPPPQIEVGIVPPAPGPGWVLEPGHWMWNGARYVWVGRHWNHLGYNAHFVPGHWARGPFGRMHWVPEHWVRF